MSVTAFTIVFDNPDHVYYAGKTMTGRVEFVVHSSLSIRGVELKIKGRAKCKWYDWYDADDDVYAWSTQTYLNSKLILVGGTGTKLKLPMGQHSYPFAVLLPSEIPSSFDGKYGGILYYGKAKIDIPFAFDYKHKARFIVLNPVNLNLYPNLRTPYAEEKNKKFWFLCWKSRPLTMVVHLPKTGFCSSERIPFTIEIDNPSDVAVRAISVHLKRKLYWTADSKHKEKKTELQTLRYDGVREHQSNIVIGYCTISHIFFPNLQYCSIIQISHKLHIVAEESTGVHSNLHFRIPITIGDIPLTEDNNSSTNPENTGSVPSNDDFPSSTSHHNIERMPQISSDVQRYPQPNYPGDMNPSPGKVVRVQQDEPLLPPLISTSTHGQPATDLERSQQELLPFETCSSIADSVTFLCSESSVQLGKSNFLDDCTNHGT